VGTTEQNGEKLNMALDKPVFDEHAADDLRKLVMTALEDLKAEDIVEMDVHDKTSVTDYVVIASGTSNRHVKSIADNVVTEAKQAGYRPLGIEGENEAEWVLVDLGDVVVHVMQPAVRDFYDLESLWQVGLPTRQETL
jgi:ribosome-associated protein